MKEKKAEPPGIVSRTFSLEDPNIYHFYSGFYLLYAKLNFSFLTIVATFSNFDHLMLPLYPSEVSSPIFIPFYQVILEEIADPSFVTDRHQIF